ncbi:MAG: CdaR family protein [Spirochaetaceae bacterium]|nr:CdaR family protein [Spirochaetaceae bacterium]
MNADSRMARLLENWPAKVLSLGLALLVMFIYNLTRLDQRTLSVQLNLSTGRALVPANEIPRTVRVFMRGEREAIYAIREADIVARLDLTRYQSEGLYRVPVRLERRGEARNIDPLELRSDPAEVLVQLEGATSKRVPVSPTFKGFLDPGYELVSYELSPQEVVIEGPVSIISKVADITTEVIELTGKTADFSLSVPLVQPSSLVSVENVSMVKFSARIRMQSKRSMLESVRVQAIGLGHGLVLTEPLPLGRITLVTGQDYDPAEAGKAALEVDLSSITTPGVYTVPVKAIAPPHADIETYEPIVLTLRVRYGGKEAMNP